MKKKFVCMYKQQSTTGGSVQFAIVDDKATPDKATPAAQKPPPKIALQLQFVDPAETDNFIYNQEYNITIAKA